MNQREFNMDFIKLTDLDLAGKRVLIRADLNVPVKDGRVTSDARIVASLPTIKHCMDAGARVMVMSHRGRPEEGKWDEENSLAPIAEDLSEKLGKQVPLIKDYLDGGFEVGEGGRQQGELNGFSAGGGQGGHVAGMAQQVGQVVARQLIEDGLEMERPAAALLCHLAVLFQGELVFEEVVVMVAQGLFFQRLPGAVQLPLEEPLQPQAVQVAAQQDAPLHRVGVEFPPDEKLLDALQQEGHLVPQAGIVVGFPRKEFGEHVLLAQGRATFPFPLGEHFEQVHHLGSQIDRRRAHPLFHGG